MSLFQEVEVNTDGTKSRTVREIKLVPLPGVDVRNIEIATDWFNHEVYLKTTEKRLRMIQPPRISQSGASHQAVIDVDAAETSSKPSLIESSRDSRPSQKPKLIEQSQQQFFRPQKLDVAKFDCSNTLQDDPVKLLQDTQELKSKVQKHEFKDSDMVSTQFNVFANPQIRQELLQTLEKVIDLTKNQVFQSSQFKDLHDGTFNHKSSLKYSELHHYIPFVKDSQLTPDNFFTLMIGEASSISHAAEFLLYQLIAKNEHDNAYPYLMTLATDNQTISHEVGKALKVVKDFDASQVIIDMKKLDESLSLKQDKLITIDEMNQIAEVVENETEFGVMLYIGSSKTPTQSCYNELHYSPYLLQHVLIGLKTLQAKGSLVIKLQETFSNFTISIIIILAKLFDNLIITKPLVSNPKTSGLKKSKPKDLISRLSVLYNELIKNPKTHIVANLLDQQKFSDEYKFLDYIKKTNEKIAIYRDQGLQPTQKHLDQALDKCLTDWGIIEKVQVEERKSSQQQSNHYGTVRRTNESVHPSAIEEPEANVKQLSEEELARIKKREDQVALEFLSGIQGDDEKKRQAEKQKQQKLLRQKREAEQLKKAQEERDRQKEKLLEKLTNKGNKTKKAAQKPDQSEKEEVVQIKGDKISIPIGQPYKEVKPSNGKDLKQESEVPKKRDVKQGIKEEAVKRKISNDQSDNGIAHPSQPNKICEANSGMQRRKDILTKDMIKIQNRPVTNESLNKKRLNSIDDDGEDDGIKHQPKKRARLIDNDDDHSGVQNQHQNAHHDESNNQHEQEISKDLQEKIMKAKQEQERQQKEAQLRALQNLSKYVAK